MSVQEAPFRLDRVIEKLATSDKPTLTIERLPEGKMRVTSNSWDGEKVLFRNEVLEVRWVEGRLNCQSESQMARHLGVGGLSHGVAIKLQSNSF